MTHLHLVANIGENDEKVLFLRYFPISQNAEMALCVKNHENPHQLKSGDVTKK